MVFLNSSLNYKFLVNIIFSWVSYFKESEFLLYFVVRVLVVVFLFMGGRWGRSTFWEFFFVVFPTVSSVGGDDWVTLKNVNKTVGFSKMGSICNIWAYKIGEFICSSNFSQNGHNWKFACICKFEDLEDLCVNIMYFKLREDCIFLFILKLPVFFWYLWNFLKFGRNFILKVLQRFCDLYYFKCFWI